MLYFVDDSVQTIGGRQAMAIGAVAMPADQYNSFCRAVYRIKQEELGAQQLTEKELKGNSNFAKAAFVRREAEGFAPHLRAVERLLGVLLDHNAAVMSVSSFDADSLRTKDDLRFPAPYAELTYRMLKYAKTAAKAGADDGMSITLFDQVGHREDQRAGAAFQNFFTRTSMKWQLARYFLAVPHFTHSSLSPGIQAADLVAYLACQQLDPLARPELAPFWDGFKAMEFRYYDGDGERRGSCDSLVDTSPTLDVDLGT